MINNQLYLLQGEQYEGEFLKIIPFNTNREFYPKKEGLEETLVRFYGFICIDGQKPYKYFFRL